MSAFDDAERPSAARQDNNRANRGSRADTFVFFLLVHYLSGYTPDSLLHMLRVHSNPPTHHSFLTMQSDSHQSKVWPTVYIDDTIYLCRTSEIVILCIIEQKV